MMPPQPLRLLSRKHAQGGAGLHAQPLHRTDHLQYLDEVFLSGTAPGRAHAKARGAPVPRRPGRLCHRAAFQHGVVIHAGPVTRALGTVGTVLGAAAGLDVEQGTELYLVGVETAPVYTVGMVQQVVEGQGKQGLDLLPRPVVARLRFVPEPVLVYAWAG
jgi:hypothetical protein